MAELPLLQAAVTGVAPSGAVNPSIRPPSQSITDLMPATSPGPPCMGQPVELPVPFISAST